MSTHYDAGSVLGTRNIIKEQAATASSYIAYTLVGKSDNKQMVVYCHTEANFMKKNQTYRFIE